MVWDPAATRHWTAERRWAAAFDMAGVYRLAAPISNPEALDPFTTARTFKFRHAGRMTARRS
jgi:hypothetical protein